MQVIKNFTYLNQNNYGGSQDCTLTSITAIVYYYNKIKPTSESIPVKDIYSVVEQIAKKYGYNEDRGTSPLVNGKIFQEAMDIVCGIDISAYSKYLKNVCWNWDTIKKSIDVGNPIILSFWKCGKYKNHTVTVVGYDEDSKELIINDNWCVIMRRIKYDDVSFISSATAVLKFR